MNCPLCGSRMSRELDGGDASVGYSGGEERFRCTSGAGCELAEDWRDDAEVQAVVEAQVERCSGGQAA